MTVRQALNEKRRQFGGKISSLVLCKRELFYGVDVGGKCKFGGGVDDTVYPVGRETAEREAKFFGVELQEE